MTAPVQEGHPTGVEPIVRDAFYIGGEWVAAADRETVDVIDATTEEVVGTVALGTEADVDRAVGAARAGFEEWSQSTVEQRMDALRAITAGLQERSEEIATLVAREVGMPIGLSRMIQAGLPIMDFGSMVNLLDEVQLEEQVGNSLIVREPVGVVGCITPWNYPLHQICAKVAPAIAAGCSVIVKPSEVTPLNAFILTEVIHETGVLPAGVFNLVPGFGPVVGEAMASHPGVDMISFTGSTRAGKRVSEVAAASVKRVALELGGKSPYVILPDTSNMQQAVINGVGKCYLNSGQTCSALTRMLVPR
ncbi:MAG TPA: aldehyde dehydrogenase family protein, partial [Thermoleophilaceae bacterium]